MKKSILLLLLCIFVSSCIDIESNISIQNDGSGSITLTYQISPVMQELGRIGDGTEPFPFPIYKEDFEKLLLMHDGLSLKSYSMKNKDEKSIVKAVILFRDVNALTPFGDGSGNSFYFKKTEEYTLFRQELPFSGIGELDEDTINMLTAYCADNYFYYRINTPKPIIEASPGDISKNRRNLVYKISIIDALVSKEKQSIIVKW